ncbi:MAG: cation-translocating P-type ATPase, partial [Kiritimatiellae bacterium]|nr:cation-translocating P-type ATPase [Kiritimatiellia bacterium]
CRAAAEPWLSRGCTPVYVTVGSEPAGFLMLRDAPRPDSAAAVAGVRAFGAEPVLLTGDGESAARDVARSVGIAEWKASCLPEDKLRWVEESERAGKPVCMIGDGVNDAPALKAARVGIAVADAGAGLAVEAADVALVGSGLSELPFLLDLSRRTMRTIGTNIAFSLALNFVAVALAAAAVLSPAAGALVHNAGALLVLANSASLSDRVFRRAGAGERRGVSRGAAR